jgi:hypothetical protein
MQFCRVVYLKQIYREKHLKIGYQTGLKLDGLPQAQSEKARANEEAQIR